MKSAIVVFALLIGGLMFFHHSLQNGDVLKYIDEHPQSNGIRDATYYIGEGYYLFQSLQEASTYYLRVAQRYPNDPLADDAYFAYLQCLEDMVTVNRAELIAGYKAYLEKYPNGRNAALAKNRYDSYATGGR